MTNIFTLENFNDFSEKISIDDLYEKKKQHDLNKLTLFNKILNRIHVKIKTTSRQKVDEQFCWFVVPEIIIGVPKYDQGACVAYLVDKLHENGFAVRYIHPNTLFICWKDWVPSYIRTELKKKTGISVNEFGKKIENTDTEKQADVNQMFLQPVVNGSASASAATSAVKKNYTSVKTYKPSGKLIYNDEHFDSLDDKLP
jgi:hypothetical protein